MICMILVLLGLNGLVFDCVTPHVLVVQLLIEAYGCDW